MKPKGGIVMKKETMLLANVNCPSCAADLQKAVAEMDGVKRVEVAFATGSLELEYDDGIVRLGDIQRTLENFGVSVVSRL